MKLLAMDTSTVSCSAALLHDDRITERHEERPREHTKLLLPMVRELMAEADLKYRNLDAIVLGVGPGSFIGVRIATSVAQGLAYASGLGIVPVSSLAAVAAAVFADQDVAEVVVTQDAHLGQIYAGHYGRDGEGLPLAVRSDLLHGPDTLEFLDPDAAGRRIAAGEGWYRYPEFHAANAHLFCGLSDQQYPRARHLLGAAKRDLACRGATNPAEIAPVYLRERVAQPATQ